MASGLITTGATSTLIGGTNYFKKKAHYTKEVDEYEKRNAMNHQAEAETMQRWTDIVNGTTPANWFQRSRARRQLARYAETTVQDL